MDPSITFEKEMQSQKLNDTTVSAAMKQELKQTHDIIGKHLDEFKKSEGNNIPDIFILLAGYFEVNEELLKTDGLF